MTDLNILDGKSVNIESDFAELSDHEINEVSGGIIPIIIGVVWAVTEIGLAVAQREICAS